MPRPSPTGRARPTRMRNRMPPCTWRARCSYFRLYVRIHSVSIARALRCRPCGEYGARAEDGWGWVAGDIIPVTNSERMFVIFVALLGTAHRTMAWSNRQIVVLSRLFGYWRAFGDITNETSGNSAAQDNALYFVCHL